VLNLKCGTVSYLRVIMWINSLNITHRACLITYDILIDEKFHAYIDPIIWMLFDQHINLMLTDNISGYHTVHGDGSKCWAGDSQDGCMILCTIQHFHPDTTIEVEFNKKNKS